MKKINIENSDNDAIKYPEKAPIKSEGANTPPIPPELSVNEDAKTLIKMINPI